MTQVISLSEDYFVHVSDIECIEIKESSDTFVECRDYYYAFAGGFDIKKAETVQAFFEEG